MGGMSIIIYNNDSTINIDFVNSFMNIKHRGPNDSNYITLSTDNLNNLSNVQQQNVYLKLSKDELRTYKQYHFALGYHRLSINDISYNGTQPFQDPIMNKLLTYKDLQIRPSTTLMANGEIYNYKDLVLDNQFTDRDLSSTSDVEVILPLYIKYGLIDTISKLDGEFTFCITENINTFELSKINTFIVRDYIGLRPLYYVHNTTNTLYGFVSEIKALPSNIINNSAFIIQQVPPGTYWSFQNTIIQKNTTLFTEYYSLDKYKSLDNCSISSKDPTTLMNVYSNIYNLINNNIITRFNSSDLPVGILLSGGFDSCLITSLLVKYLISINHNFIQTPLHVFTISDSLGSDDIDGVHAVKFVEYIETKYNIDIHHHIININNIELLSSDIDKIIYQLETYEPETVTESIPFYYLLKYIKTHTNVKVLLTGDGIDELGSYEIFNDLDDVNFQLKSVELLQNLHQFDLLRIDKMSNMFGLEIRHPFLEKNFVEYILSLHPSLKRPGYYANNQKMVSKYIIRKAFDSNVCNDNIMMDCHLWREHCCLCMSLTNFELRLSNYINTNLLTDELYNTSLKNLLNEDGINLNTLPKNKTHMYYRLIFRKYYPSRDNLVEYFWDYIFNKNHQHNSSIM
jgi:asparagine synthase (glutamine-hydrolysing)